MPIHRLDRDQLLSTKLEDAWQFFSTPRNLSLITPRELGLQLLPGYDDRAAHSGQLINYTVRPLFGIPLRWTTLIEDVEKPVRFVDRQLRGPYRLWRHTHLFQSVPGGTLMRDMVEYELPLGRFGDFFNTTVVRPRLERIFDHRRSVLSAIFAVQK